MVSFTYANAEAVAGELGRPFHSWNQPDGSLWLEFFRAAHGYVLRFPELALFGISSDGREVWCSPVSNVPSETIRHLYLNQVMPLALSRQGQFVFHGSAVEIEGQAVAFIGRSGRGKSTLAASFATAGVPFLTDDALLLDWAEGDSVPWVTPSHPSIRLWEDSLARLMPCDGTLAPALEFTSKARLLAGNGLAFSAGPRRLSHVYFLSETSSTCFDACACTGPQRLLEWLQHSFLLDIEEGATLANHFDGLTLLANRVPAFILDFPREFEKLRDTRDAIIDHALAQRPGRH